MGTEITFASPGNQANGDVLAYETIFADPQASGATATASLLSTGPVLGLAIEHTQFILDQFFTSIHSTETIDEIFGQAGTILSDFKQRVSHLSDWRSNVDLLSGIALLDASQMAGASGAYLATSPSGAPQILLSRQWVEASSIDAITGVILEEYGHALDHFLNRELDSRGDEGAMFSLKARGMEASEETRTLIASEDDHIHISLAGTSWLAEAAITTASSTTGTRVGTTTYGRGNTITFNAITISTPSGAVMLNVNAYDVDWTGTNSGEYDAVYLTGSGLSRTFVGYLNGYNNTWSWTTFDVTSLVTQAGNFTVEIEPSVSPGTSGWVVASRYASLTFGTTNGYIDNLTVAADGKVSSTLNIDTTGTYGLTYYLINSSNVVVSTYSESNSLTAGTPFSNTGDQLPNWPVADGTYTLRAVLTNSTGETIRDINTWTIVKSGGSSPSVTTTNDSDSTPPTVTITSSDNSLKLGDASTITFTFSEDIKNFDLTDITSSPNGAFGSLSSKVSNGDGTFSYSATFTPNVGVEASSNAFVVGTSWSDLAGNAPTSSTTSANYSVDTKRPTVSIVVTDTDLKIGDTSLVTFTFSEAVTGFTNADITIPNGSLSNVSSGDGGKTWTAVYTPTNSADNTVGVEDQTNMITVNMAGISDAAGNAGSGTTDSNNFGIDTIRPKISISSDKSVITVGQTTLITFTLTEETTSFHQNDVVVTGGTLTQWKRIDAKTYTAVFMAYADNKPGGNINGSIRVNDFAFLDSAGNANKDQADADNLVTIRVAPTAILRPESLSVSPNTTNIVQVSLTEISINFSASSIRSNVQISNFKKISDYLYQFEYIAPASGTVSMSVITGSFTDRSGEASVVNPDGLDSTSIAVVKASSYAAPVNTGGRAVSGVVVGRSAATPVLIPATTSSSRPLPTPVPASARASLYSGR